MAALLIIEGLMLGPSCVAQFLPQVQGGSRLAVRAGRPSFPSLMREKAKHTGLLQLKTT